MVVPPPSPPSENLRLSPPDPDKNKNVSLNQPKPTHKDSDATLLCCPFNIVYIQPDGPASCGFARGRFSRVSRAAPAPPSPPQSPRSPTATTTSTTTTTRALPAPGTLLAVKRPATGTNVETQSIQAEAAVLSYISSTTDAKERNEHVVNFYGFVPAQNAIVMDLLDRTLEEYILAQKACAASSSMEPVIGIEAWLHLARALTQGLEWLHEKAGVVHGDIKPANIMLQPKTHHTSPSPSDNQQDPFPYRAIYTDFGSSHIPSLPPSHALNNAPSFSVGTPAFTAPELLSLRNPIKRPTQAADVFSLAATLIVAITGDTRLYEASSTVAMYHLAQNGDMVLDHVRNACPMRLMPRSVQVVLVRGAVVKKPEKRWRAGEWLGLVQCEIERRRCCAD